VGSYLDARSNQGTWLVRMEDLDPPREKPGAADDILRTLEAFGFEWDEDVIYQSRRLSAYQDALQGLRTQRIVYPCSCTRREINEAGIAGLEGTRYPGTCRAGLRIDRPARAMRVRTDDEPIGFNDLVCGPVEQNLELQVGDFVVRRRDGLFAYQLAVVIDDAFQGITRIVRGSDLLVSTPRQIYLQRLLTLPTPSHAHLPLVLDSQGQKLSKQDGALPVQKKAPLPALLAALEFLKQPRPPERPTGLAEFWDWALKHWDIRTLQTEGNTPNP
jgi:glutamyl-Q tRNA(Asp) synthetase